MPSLLRSTLIVSAGYFASKLVGLARDPLIARAFGAQPELDAYYAAFNIPDLLFTLIAGGALATAFIPVFSEALAHRERAAAWQIASAVINWVLLLTAAFAALIGLFAPAIVSCCLAPGFAPPLQALTADLMRLVLVSTVVFALAGVLMGILNAQQHFLSPAFAPALYNLGIIGGAVFLAPRFGIYGLVYGVIIGSLLHLASHIPPLLRHGAPYRPVLMVREPALREIARLMGPRIAALGVIKVNTLVATNLASRLPEGSVAALNLAWNVMQIPETIIATAIATALFPLLSRYAAEGQIEELKASAVAAFRAILLLSIPALVGLVMLGRPAAQLLFERGRCDAGCVDAIVWALDFYALALIGQSLLEVAARLFYAQKDTRTPLAAALIAMTVNAGAAFALVGPLTHGGIALANALAVSVEVGVLFVVMRRRLPGIALGRIGMLAAQGALGALLMAAAIGAASLAGLRAPLPALAAGGVAAAGYFAVLWLTGVEELRRLPARLIRSYPRRNTKRHE